MTIGTLALFRGFAFILLGDKAVADFPPEYTAFGFGVIPNTFIPMPFAIFIVLAIVFWVVLHHTTIGRSLYSIGGNQTAAFFSGVSLHRLKMMLVYLFRDDQCVGRYRLHISVFQFARR